MTKSDLIDAVISQIKRDILDQEISTLEILLDKLTINDLESYLPVTYIDPRYLDDNASLEGE